MSLAAAGRMRMELCSSLVCIDSSDDYEMSGRIYHNYLDKKYDSHGMENHSRNRMGGKEFRSIIEMVSILEDVYNELDYPQSSVDFRSFQETVQEKNIYPETDKPSSEAGKQSTFVLRVMFRQNASWQGTIKWLETGASQNFRSVLELMKLMRSTVPHATKADTADDTQSELRPRQAM